MPGNSSRYLAALFASMLVSMAAAAQDPVAESRKAEYVRAVTRGAGLMPWQSPGESEQERAFRGEIERRKDALLAHSATVGHPVLYLPDTIARARAATESNDRAKKWLDSQLSLAAYVISQPSGWIDSMIPEETPANGYGFTCPKCVGVKSQEAVGHSLADWSYKEPDVLACAECGQVYPDPAYPETTTLELPRLGTRVAYYLNDAERANLDDRSGKLAWHWVGHPIHVSFTGFIRERKIGFMPGAARSTAFAYAFTGDVRYAAATRDILVRYARCYRHWPYRDYWDAYADCDPMYAAWHDRSLPIEWKRHVCESAYEKDSVEKAAMLRDYWGAGRVYPSTDGLGGLSLLCEAYDLTCAAADATGAPVWSAADRTIVERDLLLEYIMGAEPYLGGANKAEVHNNKSPRIYSAMASVAKCLGISEMAVTALTGYERVRDASFNYDGFSVESPAYNNMYLGSLLDVPEKLHGFVWPDAAQTGRAPVDYYATDPKLKLMYRAVLWTLTSDGMYLPLSDTNTGAKPSVSLPQMGLRHYPDLFEGALPALGAERMTEYALFNLDESALQKDTGLALPETCFPAWQTAVLRHGSTKAAATLALPFNPSGGHRHTDNLALFYRANGRAVLDDLGYVGDMPVNSWIHTTESHCLVVVDDSEQRAKGRLAEFSFMAASPMASVVEASSSAYAQCPEYRRRVVLIKGPDDKTFAVDLFRASGGKKHAFRICTEYAASDTADGSLSFVGVNMPPESPLPQVGASLAREDIFGLRDVRAATPGSDAWQATWRDAKGAYRLWVASPCNRVEASNGPAQRKIKEAGRRARYLDAVREGDNLVSTFLAIHEPAPDANAFPIARANRLDVSASGPRAVAAKLETAFDVYYVFNDFDTAGEVDGIRFQGTFAVVHIAEDAPPRALSVGATTLLYHGRGFENGPARFAEAASRQDASHLTLATQPPKAWPAVNASAQAYVRTKIGGAWTGFPLAEVAGNTLTVKDYPLPELEAAELLATRYGTLE